MTTAKKIHTEPDMDVQREIMKGQEKIITMYRKRLTPKFQQELQKFASSGKQIGSSDFFKLSPLVREIVVKLSMTNIDIMSKRTKNPLKKLQLWIARVATTKLASSTPQKKKSDKKVVKGKEPVAPMKKLFGKK